LAVVFAVSTAFLVFREFRRSDPIALAPTPPTEPGSAIVTPRIESPVRSDAGEPATVGESGPASAGEGAPTTSGESPQVSALELATSLLVRLGEHASETADWKRALPALRERQDEVLPILEDWIRRRKELSKACIGINAVPFAYAELAGSAAAPLLSEYLLYPERFWPVAAAALTRIDDAGAAAALRRLQERMRPHSWGVPADLLFAGKYASQNLVREWAVDPPVGHSWIREAARQTLFRRGSEEDREQVWSSAGFEEREALLGSTRLLRLRPPWPERGHDLTLQCLDHNDGWIRIRAMSRIVRTPELYGPETIARIRIQPSL